MVLFGGTGSSGSAENETWEWQLGNWTQIEADGQTAKVGPARVTNATLVYDGTDSYVLEYGGWSGTAPVSQAFSYHAGSWTKQTVPGALGGRSGTCAVWIPPTGGKGNYVLIFGGAHSTTMSTSTWEYVGGTFTNVTSTVGAGPSARNNPMCAWDPVAGEAYLFGGWTGANTVKNDLWEFNPTSGTGGAWTQLIANNTGGSPPARQLGSFFYDSSTGKMVLAGGGTGSQLKSPGQLAGGFDTWTLVGSTWTNVTSLIHVPGAYNGGIWGAATAYAGPDLYGWSYGGDVAGGATSVLTAEWTVRPTASLAIAPAVPHLGVPMYLNVTASGGTGIYHLNWTGLPGGCTPSNTTTLSCTPTIGGVYNVSVNVTDSASSPWPGSVDLLNATLILPAPIPAALVAANLTLGGTIGTHQRSTFFGTVGSPSPPLNWNGGSYSVGSLFNSTPLNYSRSFGGGQGFDPTADLNWVPPSSGTGAYVNTGALGISESAFKAYYSSLPSSQRAFEAYLPAQANSTAFAEYTAQWFHNVYGLTPIAWQFGNEPSAWTHYGINWSSWNTADASPVSNAAYSAMVKNYEQGVHALFPNDQFIGIESSSAFGTPATMIATLIASDYPYINAIAYHNYPSPNATNPYGAIGAYYSSLTGTRGIAAGMVQMRSLLTSNCGGNAGCLAMPIQIGEYQGGPSGNLSVYDGLYQGAVYMAASVILALKANVSTFQEFSLGSLIQGSVVKPEGLLYQRILENMTMGTVMSANLTGASAGGGLFAIETGASAHRSLLVVNTNLTHAVTFSVGSSFPVGVTGSAYSWNSTAAYPLHSEISELPTVYTIPSQGILLVNNYQGVPLKASIASRGPSTCTAPCPRVAFNATIAGGDIPYSLTWNWGDGTTSALPYVTASSVEMNHSYARTGTYSILLTVTDGLGNSSATNSSVTVTGAASSGGGGAIASASGTSGWLWILMDAAWVLGAVAIIAIVYALVRRSPRG